MENIRYKDQKLDHVLSRGQVMFRHFLILCLFSVAIHQLNGQVRMEEDGSVKDSWDGDADLIFPNTAMKRFSTLMIKNPQSRRRFQHILDKIRFSLVG